MRTTRQIRAQTPTRCTFRSRTRRQQPNSVRDVLEIDLSYSLNVCFCCERSPKMRLWGLGEPFNKMEPRPHNRYAICARRQQASLCGTLLTPASVAPRRDERD